MRTAGQPHVAPPPDPIEAMFDDEEDDDDPETDGERGPATALATVQQGPGALPVQRIQTQYATAVAVQQPRRLGRVLRRITREASLAGEDFFYSWTQGGKVIEGISAEGAMILVRNYGNVVVEPELVSEGPTHWNLKATFVDLEAGVTSGRIYRQRKGESHQKKQRDDQDRLLDIAFQIGQSKALRNAILRCMPEWLQRRALEVAKEAAMKRYRTELPDMVAKAIAAYKELGVTVDELEAKLVDEDGQPKPEASWTVSDVGVLRALYRAIVARETNVQKEFRPAPAPVASPPAPTPSPEPAKEKKP